jgi:SAM-dependent methyltransferase
MAKFNELNELFWSLVGPWQFMSSTLPFLYSTIQRLYTAGEYRLLLSWRQLQDAWFSAFWLWFGPQLRAGNGTRITALLEGRIKEAQIVDVPVAPPVGGVILDIGPGRGYWIDLYAKAEIPVEKPGVRSRGNNGGIQKVYGIEPNPDSHAALSKRVQEIGLDGVYEVLPVGIESINEVAIDGSTRTIEKGSVDCIVSVLCLCSIPEPEKNIAELYGYLKKGGRWYLYEHVQTKHGVFMKVYQGMFAL